jgi:hypothetical protein
MQLVTEMKFVSQILLPAIDVRREIFQQDNARPHTARLTMDYLQYQNITDLDSSLNQTLLQFARSNILAVLHNLVLARR